MCDIVIHRKDGVSTVEAKTVEGQTFLNQQYDGALKLEDSCLEYFLETVRKIGLISRLLML